MAASSLPNILLSSPLKSPLHLEFKIPSTYKPSTITSSSYRRPLRAAVIGGGPAGSSAVESLARSDVETFLIERSPSGAKPYGGAIPLCMLHEFSIPPSLVDRRVTNMRIVSPSNLSVDFGKTLLAHQHIPMLRREVLDSFLRSRAQSLGAHLISGLFTGLTITPIHPSPNRLPLTDFTPITRQIQLSFLVADPESSEFTSSRGEWIVVAGVVVFFRATRRSWRSRVCSSTRSL